MQSQHYIIRGGVEGRERLRILARVMWPTSRILFETAEIRAGMAVLDVGSGGGDVTFELARLVGPTGRVVGLDMDETKLQLARQEAAQQGLDNVAFEPIRLERDTLPPEFDVVYARFLLTHLSDPPAAVRQMRQGLKPGGVLIVEDIDCSGCFCYPDHPSFRRAVELYSKTVRSRGGDPDIGPKLPLLLLDAGLTSVQMNVVQPAGFEGEIKQIMPITLENVADAVIASGLATRDELNSLLADLREQADDRRAVVSNPRVVQAWGRA